MSNYTVLWSVHKAENLSPVQERKKFQNEYQAKWFANEMKKSYNWVICVESKNLKEY